MAMISSAVPARDSPVDVFPSSPPAGGGADRCARPDREEVEQLVTSRWRRPWTASTDSTRCARSRSAAVVHRDDLRAGDRPASRRGSWSPSGSRSITPTLPSWAPPPGADPAAVGDQPGDEDRPVVRRPHLRELSTIARYTIRNRAAARSRCGQCRHLGTAPGAAPGAGQSGAASGRRVALAQLMQPRRRALDAGLLQVPQRDVIGTGRFHRHPQPAVASSSTCSPSSPPVDLAKVTIAQRAAGRCASVTSPVVQGHQPLIGDAVINDGDGLLLIVEQLPRGNTLE